MILFYISIFDQTKINRNKNYTKNVQFYSRIFSDNPGTNFLSPNRLFHDPTRQLHDQPYQLRDPTLRLHDPTLQLRDPTHQLNIFHSLSSLLWVEHRK